MRPSLENWAGNLQFSAAAIHLPTTVEQVQEIVSSGARVKALGTRHSFNDIANTKGDLISTERLDSVISLQREHLTVTVQGGITYGRLAEYLDPHGLALGNLASLPHISVAGGCATATHGSGVRNRCLSASVSAFALVKANGELARFTREDPQFYGMVVSLGALGIVVEVTLDVVPQFEIAQRVYLSLPFEEATNYFKEIMSSGYSVSYFTDWRSPTINQLWIKERVEETDHSELPLSETSRSGAIPASHDVHPIPGSDVINCTEQMGIAGPSHERLPHFRMNFTPSSGDELQSEYLMPIGHAAEALKAVDKMRDQIAPVLHISEIRTVAADELWMSPCYLRDCVAIHFTWKKNWPLVKNLLRKIDKVLAPFDPRPHWGKLFTMRHLSYERMDEFRELALRMDPMGKFSNEFLEKHVSK